MPNQKRPAYSNKDELEQDEEDDNFYQNQDDNYDGQYNEKTQIEIKRKSQNLMNIIVHSEGEEDIDLAKQSQLSTYDDQKYKESVNQVKKRGHFRGESFGDSVPLENTLSRKEIVGINFTSNQNTKNVSEEIEEVPQLQRKLSKTDSLRNLNSFFQDEPKQVKEQNIVEKEVNTSEIENSRHSSEGRENDQDEFPEEQEEHFNDQESDFAILKKLVDKFSKNHQALIKQPKLNEKYEKFKNLNKDQLINKLVDYSSKTQKLKDKVKGLQENNQQLAQKLYKKRENSGNYSKLAAQHNQDRLELDNLKEQQKEFRKQYEDMQNKMKLLMQKYEESRLRNKKVEQRYKELKNFIQDEQDKYKDKTQNLLKEIEFLKDLVKSSVQANLQRANAKSQLQTYQQNLEPLVYQQEYQQNSNITRQSSIESKKQNERKNYQGSYSEILEQFYSNKSNYSSTKKPAQKISQDKLSSSRLVKQRQSAQINIDSSPDKLTVQQNQVQINSFNNSQNQSPVLKQFRQITQNQKQQSKPKTPIPNFRQNEASPFTMVATFQKQAAQYLQNNSKQTANSRNKSNNTVKPNVKKVNSSLINQSTSNHLSLRVNSQLKHSTLDQSVDKKIHVENIDYDRLLMEQPKKSEFQTYMGMTTERQRVNGAEINFTGQSGLNSARVVKPAKSNNQKFLTKNKGSNDSFHSNFETLSKSFK
ncbi:UNKNOWN [Stylonychia lemnae]|uniref:Uncharacterized protein n=1 Tax=Stylonychia lemnae TaxID=5949 RepID=A0A078A4Q6_STYLE|nr:UNKNOWN [Stylonychia lemnae]|eukprot:CDW77152.1 UNKNOWN [Stylonychia lemnae]